MPTAISLVCKCTNLYPILIYPNPQKFYPNLMQYFLGFHMLKHISLTAQMILDNLF